MPPAERRPLSWSGIRAAMVMADAIAISAALLLAYWLRFAAGGLALVRQVEPTPLMTLPAFAAVWMVALALNGLYLRRNTVSGIGEYRRVATAGISAILGIILFSYVRTEPYIARGLLILAFILVTLVVCVVRFSIRRFIYAMAARRRCLDRVLVVGTNQQALSVARQLVASPSASSEVVGFLSDYLPVGTVVMQGREVLGDPLSLSEVAAAQGATRALVIESGLSWESLRGIVREMHRARHVEISLVPGLFDLHSTSMAPHQIGPVFTLVPHAARIVGADAALKRTLDIVVGSLAMILALPLVAGLYLRSWIRREPPVLETFVDGRGEFTMTRFVGPPWAVERHLTRLGNLPLVITGRMSLLGPRPINALRAAEYGDARELLNSAKPGFIGPWWLAGMHRPAEFSDELMYDLYYLRNYSIWFDLHMLIQSARGIGGGEVKVRGAASVVSEASA